MLAEKASEVYARIEEKRNIFIWICVAIILLSLVRFSLWAARRGRATGPGVYMQQLQSGDKQEKKYAVYALGRTGVREALPALEEILKEDSDEEIKRVAAWSIGTLDTEKLVSLLELPQKDAKHIVMETLMKLDMEKNMGFLVKRLPHEETDTKHRILSYMESAGPAPHREELVRLAEKADGDKALREKALGMLETAGIEGFENRLWNIYYNDPDEEIKKKVYGILQGRGR